MAQYYKFNRENVRRKTGTSSLKEAIDELLALYKLQSKFDETSIVAHWEQIMGEPIAARTTQIYVKEKTLFVQFDSAPLRNELLLGKQKIIKLINKSIGQETIDEVVFI